MIFFAINNQVSFERVEHWLTVCEGYDHTIPRMLVGSKGDLREHQKEECISREDIMRKKEEFDFKAYIETSARKCNTAASDNFTEAADSHDAFSKV